MSLIDNINFTSRAIIILFKPVFNAFFMKNMLYMASKDNNFFSFFHTFVTDYTFRELFFNKLRIGLWCYCRLSLLRWIHYSICLYHAIVNSMNGLRFILLLFLLRRSHIYCWDLTLTFYINLFIFRTWILIKIWEVCIRINLICQLFNSHVSIWIFKHEIILKSRIISEAWNTLNLFKIIL